MRFLLERKTSFLGMEQFGRHRVRHRFGIMSCGHIALLARVFVSAVGVRGVKQQIMNDLSALSRLAIPELPSTGEKRGLGGSSDGPRRKQLRHYDLLPAQVFNPMGASGIEHLSDDKLWELMQRGNKAAAAFSEICFEEPDRHSVAISRFAEVYIKALNRFRDNKFSKLIIKEAVFLKIIEEANSVAVMLAKLNQAGQVQGQMTSIKKRYLCSG